MDVLVCSTWSIRGNGRASHYLSRILGAVCVLCFAVPALWLWPKGDKASSLSFSHSLSSYIPPDVQSSNTSYLRLRSRREQANGKLPTAFHYVPKERSRV